MHKLITVLILLCASMHAVAQDSVSIHPSPYHTSVVTDGAITIGGIGLTALGVKLIKDKRDFSAAEVAAKNAHDLPFFDRGNAGYYSVQADKDSYIPFHAAFGMPVLMALLNKNERGHIGQVLVLYTETMAITGTLFTMATGNVYRSRPYVYGNNVDVDMKMDNDSHRSFYAGHVAATAAATFYMAQVFADFNPHSKARPYVWALAAAMPAAVGYLRYKAGMHFLSDIVLGYGLGAAAGILVPRLHRTKLMQQVRISPMAGSGFKGLAIQYTIR